VTDKPLTNAGWGFDSMCFVCEDANERGLRIPFFSDDEAGTVTADFTLTEVFSGAPTLVHGGVLMAVCDEAMCWATIALAGTWALTAGNSHRFLRPVRLGRPYRVEARVTGRDEGGIRTEATIRSASTGKVAVEADAVFSPLGPAQAAGAIGTDVPPEHRPYLTER
jgi:acyl-coenzyme A thioesterase PaaI-like protein